MIDDFSDGYAPPKLHSLETVIKDPTGTSAVQRLRVAGGWLYITTVLVNTGPATSSAFVPDHA